MKRSNLFRIAAALLALVFMLPLGACSKYRLEMSSEKESATVMTLDGEAVPFELLYFFYQNTDRDDAHEERLSAAIGEIRNMTAIFRVAKEKGIDPDGEEIRAELDALVREMIDEFPKREDYIASLKKAHMTDSVCRRLLLYHLLRNRLLAPEDGASLVSEEEIAAYCAREDVVRVLALSVSFDASIRTWAEGRAADLHALVTEADTDAGFMEIANTKATAAEEHRYMLTAQWRALTGSEGEPAIGDISEPLFSYDNFLILRVASNKDMDYAMANIDEVMPAYMEHLVYLESTRLAGLTVMTDFYASLTAEDFV